ncbi:MAG: SRPBCC domain-containing protein [Bacteroidota bacterium]|mgnify:FL=1
MKELRTEVDINAPASKIWSILMDFDRYPEWNPFIISIRGKAHLRERLDVTVQPTGSKPMRFQPKVTLFKKDHQFGWMGNLLVVGLFDGHHIFEIHQKEEGGCTFVHREQFSGLLVPLFWKKLDTQTRAGFEAMNSVLKELAEK